MCWHHDKQPALVYPCLLVFTFVCRTCVQRTSLSFPLPLYIPPSNQPDTGIVRHATWPGLVLPARHQHRPPELPDAGIAHLSPLYFPTPLLSGLLTRCHCCWLASLLVNARISPFIFPHDTSTTFAGSLEDGVIPHWNFFNFFFR